MHRDTTKAHVALLVKIARYKRLGIPWPGGRPRKPKVVATMAEEARATIGELIVADAGVVRRQVPVAEMTPAELLASTSIEGLRRMHELLSAPLDLEDLKQCRLIGDLALGINRLFVKAAGDELRARAEHDRMAAVLALLRAESEKS